MCRCVGVWILPWVMSHLYCVGAHTLEHTRNRIIQSSVFLLKLLNVFFVLFFIVNICISTGCLFGEQRLVICIIKYKCKQFLTTRRTRLHLQNRMTPCPRNNTKRSTKAQAFLWRLADVCVSKASSDVSFELLYKMI